MINGPVIFYNSLLTSTENEAQTQSLEISVFISFAMHAPLENNAVIQNHTSTLTLSMIIPFSSSLCICTDLIIACV